MGSRHATLKKMARDLSHSSKKMAMATDEDKLSPEAEGSNVVLANLKAVETENAEYLLIYELQKKLQRTSEHFDIGGTYKESEPETWFYFTTTFCAGANHLLNLFMCHRKAGNIEISVPKEYDLSSPKSEIPTTQMVTYNFHTPEPDAHYYIKTYSFSQKEMKASEKILKHYLPITINTGKDRTLDPEIVKKIKLEHEIGALIQKENPDFTLVSSSGTEYKSHRIVLLAHSTVLREKLGDPGLQSLRLDVTDNEIEILLGFLYTGVVKDFSKQDKAQLNELGKKFALTGLISLTNNML